jgi:hypothetical protein
MTLKKDNPSRMELEAALAKSLRRIVDLPEDIQVMVLSDLLTAIENRLAVINKILEMKPTLLQDKS